jgi:hypothetical protein
MRKDCGLNWPLNNSAACCFTGRDLESIQQGRCTMIAILSRKSIFSLAVCLFMLCTSHAMDAQTFELQISSSTGSASATNTYGGSMTSGVGQLLTLTVTAEGLGAYGYGGGLYCNGGPGYSQSGSGVGQYTQASWTWTPTSTGIYYESCSFYGGPGNINWSTENVAVTVVATPAIPTIYAWPTAGTITWGQSLASSTLSGGSASVSGAFAWTTPSTIPPAGTQSESVTFTPSDTTQYTVVTGSTSTPVNAVALSSPTINTGVQINNGGGPSLVPLGNGLYSKALELVYVNNIQNVSMAYSTDGLNYTNVGPLTVPYGGGVAELDCSPEWSDHCGVAAVAYENKLYVAYNDISCNCLYVLAGTPVPNYAEFTWTLAYIAQPEYWLVTTPAMLVSAAGNLIVRYGTTERDHEAYSSVLNGQTNTWSTQDSNSISRTQSALFTIDGNNYAIDLSNPDYSGAINITELDDNGVAIPGTAYELQGGDAGNTTQGFSSTVYNSYGHCVFVTSMPPASNELQIFSTSDYYSSFANGEFWGPQTYSNIKEVPTGGDYPGDFAIAVYPPQPSGSAKIVVAYSGDSNGHLYAASGIAAPCP